MYKDIGSKIKALVECIVVLLIIIFVLVGVIGLFSGEGFGAILIAGFCSLIVWIGGFVLYGFGELIENTQEINKKLDWFVDMKLQENILSSDDTINEK